MDKPIRCSKTLYRDSFHGSCCLNKPTLFEDGKHWCAIHAPTKVKARDEAREKRWAAESAARDAKWGRENRYKEIITEMAEFLRAGTPIHPESELAIEFLTYHQ